jgi:hypothetical protein
MSTFGKKIAAVEFLLFLALLVGGVIRSFTLSEPDIPELSVPLPVSRSSSSREDFRSELRTANNLAQIGLTKAPLPQVLDQENVAKIQVYEKTAQLSSGTPAFSEDEDRARKAIATQKAAIFTERRTGIPPDRKLSLGIAVRPDRFDALLSEIEQVGQLGGMVVQQQDRTGEFRKLHAQRQSLRKHLEAIVKLRESHKLSVEEALRLEQKIQELEKESQAVGAQMGDLLGREPSYNLFLQLDEVQKGGSRDRSFTLSRRLGGAFLWALGWWALASMGVGLVVATVVSVRTLWPDAGPGAGAPPPVASAGPARPADFSAGVQTALPAPGPGDGPSSPPATR